MCGKFGSNNIGIQCSGVAVAGSIVMALVCSDRTSPALQAAVPVAPAQFAVKQQAHNLEDKVS